ncbi:MAG: DsrE family protein [Gemmatimonadetes bacterium]|nr:DsrE family protein [Gemmatimonadota bacterium]MCC6774247.1 DsrE family protein [Gemmatimonadaceae bacterium]
MIRPIVGLALAALLIVPATTTAQTGEALIKKLGASNPVSNPGFPADPTAEYKIAWNVTAGPKEPGELVDGFRRPANFLFMSDAEGLSRARVHLAIIVYGAATQSLLRNVAYKAATGKDNGSLPLLEALHEAGVKIIVCGQAIAGRKISRDELLPFVQVATSATMARATLHAQGYATFGQ